MSSPPPLQCLFCNHLNPGGASFCNDCGSQLHLQQCDLCGSINKRTARNCYKCGAVFTRAATHGLHSAILENTLGGPALSYLDIESGFSVLPGASVLARSTPPTEFSSDRADTEDYADRAAAREGVRQSSLRVQAPTEPKPVGESGSSEAPAEARGSRYRYPLTAAIVTAGIALAAYYYQGEDRQTLQDTGGGRVGSVGSGEPIAFFAGRSALLAPADVESAQSAQSATLRKFAFHVFGLDAAAPRIEPDVGSAMQKRPVASDSEVPQVAPAFEECQPAVAALGLCNSIKRGEKR